MDRSKKYKFPTMQVSYIDGICMPIYQHLAEHYDALKPMYELCLENRRQWKSRELTEKEGESNGEQ